MTKKTFLTPYGLRADPQPSDVPPHSKQIQPHHSESSGSVVVTSPTNTKPTTLASRYRLPSVSVMDQNEGGTDTVCTANGPDPGKGSPSSDHTSVSAQPPNIGKGVSSEPGSFGDNQTTMDVPTSKHEPLHARESSIHSRVIPASVSVDPPVCGNSFVADEGGRIDRFNESNLSGPLTPLEHSPSTTHIPNALQKSRSGEQGPKELGEPNRLHDENIQSTLIQQVISESPGNPQTMDSDQDSGEYELV